MCPALGPHPIPVHYWLDQLIPELNGQGITDGVIQGQVLRQLLHGELRQSLLRRIEQMPSLAAIVSTYVYGFVLGGIPIAASLLIAAVATTVLGVAHAVSPWLFFTKAERSPPKDAPVPENSKI